MTGLHRYPGIRAFEPGEQHLFFGRNEEIRRLLAQMRSNPLVVLFAKSGIGKSSLLNAGLIPLLDHDRFHAVKVRFQDTMVTPADALKQALAPYLQEGLLRERSGYIPATAPLWEYLRACRFERYEEPAVPVLIFDQFEEFFEHPSEARRLFIAAVADVANARLPAHLYTTMGEPARAPDDAGAAWHEPIQAKIIIALRSDRISQLHTLSAEIPAILQSRFELGALGREQAREAIVQPASLPGKGFATPPFDYNPETLDLMLDALQNQRREVESFQLQLVCQYIERQVMRGHAGPGPVTTGVFGGREGIQNILQNYYEDTLAELSEAERPLARNFIERGLIVGGRRVGVTEGVEREIWKIEVPLLRKLLDSRLVRTEITHLGKGYEVSHDALVEPILRSFKAGEARRLELENQRLEEENRRREQEAEAERQRAEQERQLKEDAMEARGRAERNARRARILLFVCLGLLVAVLLAAFFSLRSSRDNLLGQADTRMKSQQYGAAGELYDQVLDNPVYQLTLFDWDSVSTLSDSASRLARLEDFVLQGDTLYFIEDYYGALQKYDIAQAEGYAGLQEKMERTDRIRKLLRDIYLRKAEVMEEAITYPERDSARSLTCFYYCQAVRLDPALTEPRQKVEDLGCNCGGPLPPQDGPFDFR